MPFEVSTLLTDTEINNDRVNIGVDVCYWDDPLDSDYCFVAPTIYAENSTPKEPRHVVMLVDTSGSMRGAGISAIHSSLPKIFEALSAEDKISLVTFDNCIRTIVDDETKAALESRFLSLSSAIQSRAGTALYDAILSVAEKRDSILPGHTTVLLFTDGEDTSSKYKSSVSGMSVSGVLDEYHGRFDGKAPRIFPIGLGDYYDHAFMKQCAIAANFGRVDARDQTRLDEHVAHIISGIAHGFHVALTLGSEHISPSIMGYNTENKQTPIRIPKSELASGLTVGVGSRSECIASDIFRPAKDEAEMIARMQAYFIQKGQQIYDALGKTFVVKMNEIEEIIYLYRDFITPETAAQLQTLLVVLDKKELNRKGQEIVAGLARAGYEAALREAKVTGVLQPEYPENADYLETVIERYKHGGFSSSSPFETIARRVPPAGRGIEAESLSEKSNQFIPMSTFQSAPFRLALSQARHDLASRTVSSTQLLNRNLNFSELAPATIVLSRFTRCEDIYLPLNSAHLSDAVIALRAMGADDLKIKCNCSYPYDAARETGMRTFLSNPIDILFRG